jgi:hypothetical protein
MHHLSPILTYDPVLGEAGLRKLLSLRHRLEIILVKSY